MERTISSTSQRHVLVLEDDASIAELLVWVLSEAGYQVSTASTVSEARSLCQDKVPAIIIADLLLPDGLGTELIHEIRQSRNGESPPLIIMSALPQVEQHAEAAGAVFCLGKPFDLTDLLNAVAHLSSDSAPDLVAYQRK